MSKITEVTAWCKLNKLTVNIDKTKIMTVSSSSKIIDNTLLVAIDGKNLQKVHKYEYLGVIMDDKLCMNNHIDHIEKFRVASVLFLNSEGI